MFALIMAVACGDADVECEAGTSENASGDCVADQETDTDTDTDTDSDADTDTDTDSDTDTDTDTDIPDPLGDDDGDGVTNGDEATLGTDPEDADSDDDSYLDGWEVTEGTDPLDYESRIYVGFWPYNPDKDSYGAPDWSGADLSIGAQLPRFAYADQYGDSVDIYDFAGQGKDVLFVPMAVWADACQSVTDWLIGVSDVYGFEKIHPGARDAVVAGDVYWVTDLEETGSGNPPPDELAQTWFDEHPADYVTVLAGDGDAKAAYVDYAWPTLILLDENLTIVSFSTQDDWYAPLDDMVDRL